MSVEVGKGNEQNFALLNFLAGRWTTKFTVYCHGSTASGIQSRQTCRSGVTFCGLFQPLPEGGIAGNYMPLENCTGDDESMADNFLRLELDRADNAVVAYLGNDKFVPGIKGVWSNSVLRFRRDFYDGITMWEVFKTIWPEVTARPSAVSLIFCQVSETVFFLDVAFDVERSYSSQGKPVGLRCRLEFWNFRKQPGALIPPHPQDVEESFDEVLKKCDEVTQDVEFRLDEIDGLIASLEDSRAKYEEQLRLLEELKSNAGSGKDGADSLDDDMQELILELHEKPLVPTEGAAVAGEVKDILARTWSELDDLQADVESLETEMDSIEAGVDLPNEELISSAWTNAEYARGQRLLREHRNHLPPPDLSFLGPLQSSVSNLSKAATKFVKTTAMQVQMALRGEPPEWLDYGPPIASMGKACERILADVFMEKKEAFAGDLVIGAMISDVSSWQYRIPASMMSKVNHGDLMNVVKMVKKSIETNAEIRWIGMGNKRIALLLFGGWIPVYQTSGEYVLNPLGVDSSSKEYVKILPERLSEFQSFRNGFVHHDLAEIDDLLRTWKCFQDCLKGVLQAFYSASE